MNVVAGLSERFLESEIEFLIVSDFLHDPVECVNDGVACDNDVIVMDVFFYQIFPA